MSDLYDELPDWLDKEAWAAFLDFRKAKAKVAKAPFTDLARKRILFELDRLRAQGHPSGPVLWQSTVAGWTSVYALKHVQSTGTVESFEVAATKQLLQRQTEHSTQAIRGPEVAARIAAIKQKLRGQA